MAKPIFSEEELMACLERRWAEERRFLSPEQMGYYMQFRLWKAPEDQAYVVLLNRSRCLIRSIQLTEGMLHRVNLLSDGLKDKLAEASYFFVGHTHGTHSTEPSPEDIYTTKILSARFREKPVFLGQVIVNHQMDFTFLQP